MSEPPAEVPPGGPRIVESHEEIPSGQPVDSDMEVVEEHVTRDEDAGTVTVERKLRRRDKTPRYILYLALALLGLMIVAGLIRAATHGGSKNESTDSCDKSTATVSLHPGSRLIRIAGDLYDGPFEKLSHEEKIGVMQGMYDDNHILSDFTDSHGNHGIDYIPRHGKIKVSRSMACYR